jgi:hypothetical protein
MIPRSWIQAPGTQMQIKAFALVILVVFFGSNSTWYLPLKSAAPITHNLGIKLHLVTINSVKAAC